MALFLPGDGDGRVDGRGDGAASRSLHVPRPEEVEIAPAQDRHPTDAYAQELKTCVSIVAGWTELISRGLLVDKEVELACDRIRQACSRIIAVASGIEALDAEAPQDEASVGPVPSTVPHDDR